MGGFYANILHSLRYSTVLLIVLEIISQIQLEDIPFNIILLIAIVAA